MRTPQNGAGGCRQSARSCLNLRMQDSRVVRVLPVCHCMCCIIIMYVCMCVFMCARMFVCVSVSVCLCMCDVVCVCVCVCACVCVTLCFFAGSSIRPRKLRGLIELSAQYS